MLREYVYLDRNRVEDFLSQLEGGVSENIRQSETATGAGLEGGINVGVARIGASLTAPSISQDELRRTTDVSLFNRLHLHLQRDDLRVVSDADNLNWSLIKPGSLLELGCVVVVSGISKLSQTLSDMGAIAPVLGKSLDGMEGFGALFGGDVGVRYLLDDKIVAYSNLDPDSMRANLSELEGECTALVRIRKVLRTGKRTPLRSVAGMKLDVAKLEDLITRFDGAPAELGFKFVPDDLIASGPSAIVTTVAIYR